MYEKLDQSSLATFLRQKTCRQDLIFNLLECSTEAKGLNSRMRNYTPLKGIHGAFGDAYHLGFI
jgi:hypothetical protein